MRKKTPNRRRKELSNLSRTMGIGLMIPAILTASIVVTSYVGMQLDNWLGTSPWLTLIFLFLGIAAGIREMIRLVKKLEKDK